jgi:inner membrane protein
MPSPLGHSLAGIAVHAASAGSVSELRSARRLALVVGAALAPDIDLLFRFVDGRNHHNNETHSLGAALLAGLAAALLARLKAWPRPTLLGLAVGAGWASHVLLDYLNLDTNPPIGIQAFWPVSSAHYKIPWPIFLDVGRTFGWDTVRKNSLAAAWEAAVLAPIAWACWRARARG